MSVGWRLPDRRATTTFGQLLAKTMQPGDLLLLDGDLGAGKTFLVRAMLRAWGLPHEVAVRSPTFVLVEEYNELPAFPVIHADLYRLAGDQEQVGELGLLDRRRQGAAVIVEWGAPFGRALGGEGLGVRLAVDTPTNKHFPRSLTIEALGARGRAWAEEIATLHARASDPA